MLTSVILVTPFLSLQDGEPVLEAQTNKEREHTHTYIYIPMNSIYKIKELYNKSQDTFIGKKCIVVLY
jgi:hypothetical protein